MGTSCSTFTRSTNKKASAHTKTPTPARQHSKLRRNYIFHSHTLDQGCHVLRKTSITSAIHDVISACPAQKETTSSTLTHLNKVVMSCANNTKPQDLSSKRTHTHEQSTMHIHIHEARTQAHTHNQAKTHIHLTKHTCT